MENQLAQSNPGRSHLPAWNRTGLCRKPQTEVRKLSRDRLPPIADTEKPSEVEDTVVTMLRNNVMQLEKNMVFLKKQHQETLGMLHEEVEQLKLLNRDLNFKLVMCRCGGKGSAAPLHRDLMAGHDAVQPNTSSENPIHAVYMLEDVQKLKNLLATERNKNNRLLKFMEKKMLEKHRGSLLDADSSSGGHVYGEKGITGPRAPTIEECEAVIKDLQRKNSKQTHELLQIKADLRDVLYSHKWTPDAFLMARAYVSEDIPGSVSSSTGTLPSVVPVTDKRKVERAYQRVKEEVSLPALKPRVPGIVAEKHRRAQAVRGRVGRGCL